MRDLLGVEFMFQFDPTTDFPADGADAGFDTNGSVLSLSEAHLAQYFEAASRILDKVLTVDGLDGPSTHRWAARELHLAGGAKLEGGRIAFSSPGAATAELRILQEGEYSVRSIVSSTESNGARAQMAIIADEKDERFTLTRQGKPSATERKIKLQAGMRQIGLAYRYEQDVSNKAVEGPMRGSLGFDFIELTGPLHVTAGQLSEGHRRIFIRRPDAQTSRTEAAREVIAQFASRVFRRPATASEVEKYLRLFAASDAPEISFELAMKPVLLAVLVSPNFLFRVETERTPRPQDGAYALSADELATRLSYFVWSSLPDDELRASAASGRLLETAELERQARRMLAEPKAAALAQNFVTQWLGIRTVETFQPEKKRFGELGSSLRKSLLAEPVLVFQSILGENRSLLALLDADFTFANEELCRLYGLPFVKDPVQNEKDRREMRRVTLLPESHRGGILTMGSVLAATSHPTRTSPVKRGKWVLDNLLGTPPPPPAPNVPPLPERRETGEKVSLRQQMEQHRADAACATCHKRMDPIGFAFENFDAMGRWRQQDESRQKIDATGTLPDGSKIDGTAGLRELLLSRKDDFARCLALKLLTYGLGRSPEPYDRRAMDNVVRTIAPGGYRLSDLVVELVQSYPFRNRHSAPPFTASNP
ncbi:MAG TPA: DUF1592 domain-containing protein [Chthoniobacteraceae bacterium]|nr:DUF1592 domain-containing protein [Chthoniobacteraceae bacterium]